LTWKEKAVTHTLYVPVEMREEVRTWVNNWKVLRRLIRQMSQAQREFLLYQKKTAKRS
jgi:DNA-dependent RNA polymerase auxiliary subunit epsilon